MNDSPSITVRALTLDDADGLVACFKRCYGDTYSCEDFYHAELLRERILSGSLQSVVAITGDGHLIGHIGLSVRHSGARAIEAGNTVVDPDYRGQGLLGRLGKALEQLCVTSGFDGYLHYPTTAHSIMQKRSIKGGGVETGVMLDYIPADTEYRAIDRGDGRLATTVVYQPFRKTPKRGVFLPQGYREILGDLYRAAALDRVAATPLNRPTIDATVESRSFEARRSLLHLHVDEVGDDFEKRVKAATTAYPAAVTHVDLSLDDPAVDRAVGVLRGLGFFFCALLPEFARCDVLRLQRLRDPSQYAFAPSLANAGARGLLSFMVEDARR